MTKDPDTCNSQRPYSRCLILWVSDTACSITLKLVPCLSHTSFWAVPKPFLWLIVLCERRNIMKIDEVIGCVKLPDEDWKKPVDNGKWGVVMCCFMIQFPPLLIQPQKAHGKLSGAPTRGEETCISGSSSKIRRVQLNRTLKHAYLHILVSQWLLQIICRSLVWWNPNTCFVLISAWTVSTSTQSTRRQTRLNLRTLWPKTYFTETWVVSAVMEYIQVATFTQILY